MGVPNITKVLMKWVRRLFVFFFQQKCPTRKAWYNGKNKIKIILQTFKSNFFKITFHDWNCIVRFALSHSRFNFQESFAPAAQLNVSCYSGTAIRRRCKAKATKRPKFLLIILLKMLISIYFIILYSSLC